jgi:hypothetical protein
MTTPTVHDIAPLTMTGCGNREASDTLTGLLAHGLLGPGLRD